MRPCESRRFKLLQTEQHVCLALRATQPTLAIMVAEPHIVPMSSIRQETFRADPTNVFSFEGKQIPLDINHYGNIGDIFAFRGIGGKEVVRCLYVKLKKNVKAGRQMDMWVAEALGARHPSKSANFLVLCQGVSFWPLWQNFPRKGADELFFASQQQSFPFHFDYFFRLHANRQPGIASSTPIDVDGPGSSTENPIDLASGIEE